MIFDMLSCANQSQIRIVRVKITFLGQKSTLFRLCFIMVHKCGHANVGKQNMVLFEVGLPTKYIYIRTGSSIASSAELVYLLFGHIHWISSQTSQEGIKCTKAKK